MGYAQSASRFRRAVGTVVAGVAALVVFGLAEPAAADVSVNPTEAEQLAAGRLTFRVTNDNPTASIVRVEVRLPVEAQILEAYPIAVPDWAPLISMTATGGDRSREVATAVTWVTMPGKDLKPGASADLLLAMGPLPAIDTLYIDVVETRSDGTTEMWAGAGVTTASAQHPALELALRPQAAPPVDDAAAAEPESEEATGGWNSGRLLLILLVIGVVTLFAYLWQRRASTRADDAPPETAAAESEPPVDDAKPEDNAPAVAAEKKPAVRKKSVVRKTPAPRRTAAARRGGAPAVTERNRAKATATKSTGDN
jgi:hypothetical protein